MIIKFLRDSWLGSYLAKKDEVLELEDKKANVLINFGIVVKYDDNICSNSLEDQVVDYVKETQEVEKEVKPKTKRNNKK